eukprot:9303128-Alexandrium_andersonii.AAC.1
MCIRDSSRAGTGATDGPRPMDPSAGKSWRDDLRPFQSEVLARRCWRGDQPSGAGTVLPDRTSRA